MNLVYEIAFESLDLKIFSKCGVWMKAPCELRILVTECGSHVLSPEFELQ